MFLGRGQGQGGGFGLNVSGGEVPRIAGIFSQDGLPQATTKLANIDSCCHAGVDKT